MLRQNIIGGVEDRRDTFELVTQAHEPRRRPYEFTIRLPAPHSRLRADGGPGRGVRPSQGNPVRRDSTQAADRRHGVRSVRRTEEHTSELQSLMRISYAVFCLKKKKTTPINMIRMHIEH